MRKSKERYSKKAKAVLTIASQLAIKYGSDPNWSLAEAIQLETPTGEVHLHWSSHRGQGKWNIITNPQWRGEICGTIRCRRVIISPLGGENESSPYDAATFDEVRNKWLWTREGACCYWPRLKTFDIGNLEPVSGEYMGYESAYVHIENGE